MVVGELGRVKWVAGAQCKPQLWWGSKIDPSTVLFDLHLTLYEHHFWKSLERVLFKSHPYHATSRPQPRRYEPKNHSPYSEACQGSFSMFS